MVVKFQWKASILAGSSSAKHPQILLLAALLQRGDQGGGQLQGQGGGGGDRGGDGGQPQDRDRGYFHSEILSDSKKNMTLPNQHHHQTSLVHLSACIRICYF